MVLRVCGKDLDVCMYARVCQTKKKKTKQKAKKKQTKKLNKYIPMIVFVYARMLFLFL